MTEPGGKRSAFTPNLYEIHGNIKYMHCSNEKLSCANIFYPIQRWDKVAKSDSPHYVPKCSNCSSPMKPHTMFFDEMYSEKFYRAKTVYDFVENSDCLVVVGTTLLTGMASNIVSSFVFSGKPVIEINLSSFVNQGLNLQVKEKAEIALPALFGEYYKLKRSVKKK